MPDWIDWTSNTRRAGEEASMTVPFTFADFAMSEGRFRKHFRKAPPETWNDSMVPWPSSWTWSRTTARTLPLHLGVDAKNRLMRVLVSEELVRSCEERRGFWTQLRGSVR
jgi:pyruvate-ferredoxin/flavodoxin oxidoreductase